MSGAVRKRKAESGALYHHKHDVAPSFEELTAMTLVAFTGDARVDADVLPASEAGMAIAVYLPTGMRGSELKRMRLQSLGHESIQHQASGERFECLKMTAFDCKTRDHHLSQLLPHSNAWRCGVGALGVCVLLRVALHGPPPTSMRCDAESWHVLGAPTGASFDRRLKDVFRVAGVRRQLHDPLTYLGRHVGSRQLQHAGGTSEGGAARRGHAAGSAWQHYTECPLPDLLRLAGNDPQAPFVAAHLAPSLHGEADAVVTGRT